MGLGKKFEFFRYVMSLYPLGRILACHIATTISFGWSEELISQDSCLLALFDQPRLVDYQSKNHRSSTEDNIVFKRRKTQESKLYNSLFSKNYDGKQQLIDFRQQCLLQHPRCNGKATEKEACGKRKKICTKQSETFRQCRPQAYSR